MALSTAYARARHAATLFVVGSALGFLSSVASASTPEVWPSGARLRFSTTGVPVWTTPVVPAASTAAGGGAALLRATQSLNIGGVSVPIALTRNVPVSNVARVLAVGARFMGPLAVAGLVYEGVRFAQGEWLAEESTVLPGGITWYGALRGGQLLYPASSGLAACNAYMAAEVPGGYCVRSGGDEKPDNLDAFCQGVQGCSDGSFTLYNADGTVRGTNQVAYYRLAPCASGSTRDSSTGECVTAGERPATEDDLQISFQQGLIQAPTLGPTLLDLALQDSRARAALLAEAMQLDGPATVEGPTTTTVESGPAGDTTINRSVTYNITLEGDVVTVTETVQETRTDPDNNVTVTTTTTEVPAASEPQGAAPAEDIECGLPGTPKCAIDETGTPDGSGVDQAGLDVIHDAAAAIEDGITGIGESPVDDLGFGFDVDLPAGSCSPLVLSYKSWSHSVNWCPTLGVARDIWGWFIGVMGALYVFRRATNPMV